MQCRTQAVNNSRTWPRFHYRDKIEAGLETMDRQQASMAMMGAVCRNNVASQFFRERHGWGRGVSLWMPVGQTWTLVTAEMCRLTAAAAAVAACLCVFRVPSPAAAGLG